MKRKAYETLLHWKKERNGASALLVNGPRRVGKSYLVEEFGRQEYKSYILIDFNKDLNQVEPFFNEYINDLDTFFLYLSNYAGIKLYERESLIIFDEIQLCPRARAALKFLVADGRYDYIETGSLVSIKKNVENIVIPSEEEELFLYPMDFEEFLWATGEDMLMPLIQQNFAQKHEMGQTMHRRAMSLFRQYLIVGGMPQAVLEYVQTRDFDKVDIKKRQILTLYRNDIQKFARGYESRVTALYDSLPSQLQRHDKKFVMKKVADGARKRDYETAFFWLSDAMITNMAYNTTEPNIGLWLNMDNSTLKCYMMDTGLLVSHSFNEKAIASENLYNKILSDKLEFNGGMVIENIVAQMLKTAGHRLYFFSKYDKGNAEERMEIDFLIAKNQITSRHNISPIEVKSTTNYTLTSLKKCIAKYGEYLSTPYVVHTADYFEKDGVTYLPLYMVPLI